MTSKRHKSSANSLLGLYFVFYLMVAYLPFSNAILKFDLGFITLNLYTIGLFLYFFVAFIEMLRGNVKAKISMNDLVILCWCSFYFISTLLSTSLSSSGYIAFHAIFIPVFSYFIIKTIINNEVRIELFTGAFVFGCFIFAVPSIYEYLISFKRVEILAMPAISAATFTISALFIILYGTKLHNILKIFIAIILLTSLYVTFTRLYFFILILSPIIYYMFRKGFALNVLIASQILTLIFTIHMISISNNFRPPMNTDISQWSAVERITNPISWKISLYNRGSNLKEGLVIFENNVIIGTGIQKGEYVTRHNFHIEWLEYGGLLGYMLGTIIFLLHFKKYGPIAAVNRSVAVNLLIIFCVFTNGVFNGLMHGIMPLIIFIFMALNEAIFTTNRSINAE